MPEFPEENGNEIDDTDYELNDNEHNICYDDVDEFNEYYMQHYGEMNDGDDDNEYEKYYEESKIIDYNPANEYDTNQFNTRYVLK